MNFAYNSFVQLLILLKAVVVITYSTQSEYEVFAGLTMGVCYLMETGFPQPVEVMELFFTFKNGNKVMEFCKT